MNFNSHFLCFNTLRVAASIMAGLAVKALFTAELWALTLEVTSDMAADVSSSIMGENVQPGAPYFGQRSQ